MDRRRIENWWRRVAADENPSPFVGFEQGLLLAASMPFEAVARIRDFLYETGMLAILKLPVPVISFGNLTVGGTGKTPAAVWCADYLARKGLRPGIASRGYNPEVGHTEPPNDEAELIRELLPDVPHVWDADRAKAGKVLVKERQCNVVILDDGYQHRRVHRTIDFLLVDALAPFGHGYMLPRGLLREPMSALRRASTIIITRSNLVSREELVRIRQKIWRYSEGVRLAEAVHRPTGLYMAGGVREEVEALRDRKVFAFCAIANPQSFFMTLSNLGARSVGTKTFPDHHVYDESDLKTVFSQAATNGADLVVTTQKDRVKTGWREGSEPPLAELRVRFELVKGREFVEPSLDFLAKRAGEGSTA